MEEMDLSKTPLTGEQPSYATYETEVRGDNSAENLDQEKQREIWQRDLLAIEGEIKLLSETLHSKIAQADDLKHKLGISLTPWKEIQHTFQSGMKTIRESTPYQKTSAAAKTVQEKTSSAFNTLGTSVSKKIGDVRNSQTFKSLEEKVESTYTNVKAKVRGSKSENELKDEQTSVDNPNSIGTN